jgi:nitroreductase
MNAAEELFSLLKERRSIRAFRKEPIDEGLLLQLLEAATWAPSAGNRQDWFFTVVLDPATKSRMAKAVQAKWREIVAANQDIGAIGEVEHYSSAFASFREAPVVIAVSARRPDAFQEHILGETATATTGSATSAAMAAQNLMLAAHALGLGSCCMTGAIAAREELARLVGLPRKQEIVCLIALGAPAACPPAPERRPLPEIMRIIK